MSIFVKLMPDNVQNLCVHQVYIFQQILMYFFQRNIYYLILVILFQQIEHFQSEQDHFVDTFVQVTVQTNGIIWEHMVPHWTRPFHAGHYNSFRVNYNYIDSRSLYNMQSGLIYINALPIKWWAQFFSTNHLRKDQTLAENLSFGIWLHTGSIILYICSFIGNVLSIFTAIVTVALCFKVLLCYINCQNWFGLWESFRYKVFFETKLVVNAKYNGRKKRKSKAQRRVLAINKYKLST